RPGEQVELIGHNVRALWECGPDVHPIALRCIALNEADCGCLVIAIRLRNGEGILVLAAETVSLDRVLLAEQLDHGVAARGGGGYDHPENSHENRCSFHLSLPYPDPLSTG